MADNHDTATVNRKGLAPKLSGSATDVLRGDGTYGASPTPDPLLLGNGSATNPTYSFSSDTDVGIYRITTNTLGLATAGAEAWRILSTGELRGPDAATTTAAGTTRIIRGGPGGSVSGDGGVLTLISGSPTSGNGGDLSLFAAAGAGSGNSGGSINANGGNGVGTGSGGQFQLQGGSGGSTSGQGGGINAIGGTGGGTGDGGFVLFSGGVGGTTSGNGGLVQFESGNVTSGSGNSGDINFNIPNPLGSGIQGNLDFKSDNVLFVRMNPRTNHISHAGTTPSITAGGGTSPSIVGKDEAFIVTIGTGGVATSVEVTFANAFTNAPAVNAQSDTDIVAFKVVTLTTKVTITATAPFTAGSKIHVICRGYE